MKLLIVLAMLAARAASVEDLLWRMFVFPVQSDTARATLTPSMMGFTAVTVCHRSFTDLTRDHALFSMSTNRNENAFLVFWNNNNQELVVYVNDDEIKFRGLDYKRNTWHSICSTWNSETGLVQMWFDGLPSILKSAPASPINGNVIIILGQEQDSHGGGFNSAQSFVGMMTDVYMWDYVLSPCEIQRYVDNLNFTPGKVLSWKAMEYNTTGNVLVHEQSTMCHNSPPAS